MRKEIRGMVVKSKWDDNKFTLAETKLSGSNCRICKMWVRYPFMHYCEFEGEHVYICHECIQSDMLIVVGN